MTGLLIATTNPGKIREIQGILNWIPITLLTLEQFPGIPEPEETGTTFARERAAEGGVLLGADGRPGGRRRFGTRDRGARECAGRPFGAVARHGLSGQVRGDLPALAARGLETSAARFVAHIALAHDGNILYEATGIVQGEIAPEPKGSHGFGYDPIFFYPPYECTLAEVDGAKKAAVSHRGKAFRQLRNWLEASNLP